MGSWGSSGHPDCPPDDRCKPEQMGRTNEPPERNDDQDDDLKAGEEVSCSKYPSFSLLLPLTVFLQSPPRLPKRGACGSGLSLEPQVAVARGS